MRKIAIVGTSFELPKSKNLTQLGKILSEGIDTITDLDNHQKENIPKGYILDEIKGFDSDFFDFTESEIIKMDPQHRLFLELCWKVLDSYGHLNNMKLLEKTGVFSGITTGDYLFKNIGSVDNLSYSTYINNLPDTAATKVSYKFGLKGLSLSINSACSSGSVALKLAIDNLLNEEIDMALVGSCKVLSDSENGYLYKENSIFSKRGKCSPFDTTSDGIVPGNGGIVLALKTYEKAIDDKDEILAIINSIAINNDGSDKNGYTSPSVLGQKSVIKKAYQQSNINIEEVDYLEMHGTGTAIGDAIEIRSTEDFFKKNENLKIGSVKSNFGHLDTASGLAGVLKAIWMLKTQTIPKQSNFTSLNPYLIGGIKNNNINCASTNKEINYIGINSFGIGGTNCHIVMERYPETQFAKINKNDKIIFPLSTKRKKALYEYKGEVINLLSKSSELDRTKILRTLLFNKKIQNYVVFLEHDLVKNTTKEIKIEYTKILGLIDQLREKHNYLLSYPKIQTPIEKLNKKRLWVERIEKENKNNGTGESNVNIDEFVNLLKNYLDVDKEQLLDMKLKDFYIDSFLLIEMLESLEKVFNIKLSPSQFLNSKETFSDLYYKSIDTRNIDNSQGRMNNIQSLYKYSPAKKNIYIFHPAGGTVLGYKKIFQSEESSFNFILVSFPFEYYNTVSYFSLEQLASFYLDQIRKTYSDEDNYILCGYSFGGNVAFEIASQLEKQGATVEQLILIDSYPMDAYFMENYHYTSYTDVFEIIKSELDNEDHFVSNLLNLEQHDQLLKVWELNHSMLKKYKKEVRLNCATLLLECEEDENPLILKKLSIKPVEKNMWSKYFRKSLTIEKIKGNHYSIFSKDSDGRPIGEIIVDFVKYKNLSVLTH
ncbi:beta-ketoacyl synthase N-terminal-like domain-containing protein [Bacillus mojavensis]|uniref:beta-ketoacyl synthase N-terminal-like domain-containing protein n=1 Tax=Bacillus mojavensis TaxID=72360 RepID=UPI002DBC72CD|nr:beta-ketoacyl synthase N-terminal-like domain-containing protein [Bacillus mojavensis]MEC1685490.1 beta-ketoacyl synthase N-terminal-like domain-containing protein [Bacillus mojavensis]MEC1708279.1 beta-ketoacyl synthase N-terminal-like domain-containing protein [Bacillus mojavensis]